MLEASLRNHNPWPAGSVQAKTEVYVFEARRVRSLVHSADVVEGLTPEHQAGARGLFDLCGRGVVEVGRAVAYPCRIGGPQLINQQEIRRPRSERGESSDRKSPLNGAVRVNEDACGSAGPGAPGQKRSKRVNGWTNGRRIRVEEQQIFVAGVPSGDVHPAGKPMIGDLTDQPNLWKFARDAFDAAVIGRVVHDDHFMTGRQQRCEARPQKSAAIPI